MPLFLSSFFHLRGLHNHHSGRGQGTDIVMAGELDIAAVSEMLCRTRVGEVA